MNTYEVNQKINEIAKANGLRTIEEVYSTMKDIKVKDPSATIERLQGDIKAKGFEYYFEADEEKKGVIAQMLVYKAAQIKNIIER